VGLRRTSIGILIALCACDAGSNVEAPEVSEAVSPESAPTVQVDEEGTRGRPAQRSEGRAELRRRSVERSAFVPLPPGRYVYDTASVMRGTGGSHEFSRAAVLYVSEAQLGHQETVLTIADAAGYGVREARRLRYRRDGLYLTRLTTESMTRLGSQMLSFAPSGGALILPREPFRVRSWRTTLVSHDECYRRVTRARVVGSEETMRHGERSFPVARIVSVMFMNNRASSPPGCIGLRGRSKSLAWVSLDNGLLIRENAQGRLVFTDAGVTLNSSVVMTLQSLPA
jgi:hypothetical protein